MKPATIAIAAALVLAPAAASADGHDKRFYIGADYSNIRVGLDSAELKAALDASYNGGGIRFGKRISDRFSAEAGYFRATGGGQTLTAPADAPIQLSILDQKLTIPANATARIQEEKVTAFALDGFAHFPLGDGRLEGLAGAGIAYGDYEIIAIETTNNTRLSVSESAPILRFALGAEYRVNDRAGVRALVRYYPTFNQISGVSDLRELSVGFNISF